jgi:hypothetical protein
MKPVALERLSCYLSMHIKNVQIGGCMHPMLEFEDTIVLDSEWETNMGSK